MRNVLLGVCLSVAVCCLQAQPVQKNDVPFVGAQVFVEPGQTAMQMDEWFSAMEQQRMTICRIRMFQQYMEHEDGSWDFSLFDKAFEAARRHHVRIYCTLFPTTDRTDIGGWKFPKDESQQESFARFIQALVSHYSQHESLKGWVIINEPGTGGDIPHTPFGNAAWERWQQKHPDRLIADDGFPILTAPRRQAFTYDFTAEYLNWIASEIRKYDTKHDIHVNPADVFGNIGDYDWHRWRTFLSSLGGSAHPSWHYYHFDRQQYATAMAIESEILKAGAGTMPWLRTEIQGGNNTWSGGRAMCPTKEEIAQWLWTVIGTEGKGGIFWMLNPRSSGIEAGEWALLDFQYKPSERMKMAGKVAECIQNNAKLFAEARQQMSGVDIVYSKESRWAEQLMSKRADRFVGREDGAVFKSIAACWQALAGRGIQAGIRQLDDYDFSQADYSGRTIILAHQIALPRGAQAKLEQFVSRGGTLIAEGLTGFFDENLHNTNTIDFFWRDLFGGEVSEYICHDDTFEVNIGEHCLKGYWQSGLIANSGKHCLKQNFGKGRVVWVPSCISLGAWVSKDYAALSDFLVEQIPADETVRLDGYYENVLMRTLQSGRNIITICINKSKHRQLLQLEHLTKGAKPQMLFSLSSNVQLSLQPEDVQVILWKH